MRAVVQRVLRASVAVDGATVASIGPGLLVLLGVKTGDDAAAAAYVADKIGGLRVFGDEGGKMNRSLADAGGEVLVVSQFTLYADTRRGRRPSFVEAAPPEVAQVLVTTVANALGAKTGVFGAHMVVELVNDGPVTIVIDSP